MNGLKHIAKIREYCDYIEEHLLNVEKAWKILQEKCKDMRFIYDDFVFWSIDEMIKNHDMSKMSLEEFIPYQQQFFPVGEKPDWANPVFAAAWIHHKAENLHHWESWVGTPETTPYDNECHCVCMVADWMAMGMKLGGTAEDYYRKNYEKIKLPEWAVKFIGEIFERLKA